MGVQGLQTFIKSDDRFLVSNYHLHNTKVVVDANNLSRILMTRSDERQGSDLVGVDLVGYGRHVELFLDNLRRCKIDPVLIFDGAQTSEANTSKTPKKIERHKEKQCLVLSTTKGARRTFIQPRIGNKILKSIAIDRKLEVFQCFYEADEYAAKLANDLCCPVMSDDSDFFVLGVENGCIPIDSLRYERVRLLSRRPGGLDSGSQQEVKPYWYIECSYFNQNLFVQSFHGLDKKCLPLLGVLAGNDITDRRFRDLLEMIVYNVTNNTQQPQLQGLLNRSFQQEKIFKTLYFFCGKTLEQNIDSIAALVEEGQQKNIRMQLEDGLKYYDLSIRDTFDEEIFKHYKEGFYTTFAGRFRDPVELERQFQLEIGMISSWIRKQIETSDLTKICLELALRNCVFLRPEMDDFREPSAHRCIYRCLSVMLTLMRSSVYDNEPCPLYDRYDSIADKSELQPLLKLESCSSSTRFLNIDFLIYDVLRMSGGLRASILLSTFHSSVDEFAETSRNHYNWFEPNHAEEFVVIKIILNYIEKEEDTRLPVHFHQSILLAYLYHLFIGLNDRTFIAKCEDEGCLQFMIRLKEISLKNHLEKSNQCPISHVDISIIRHIVQFQTVIQAYNELNAFLGDTMVKVKPQKWFNSSFIYNLTDNMDSPRYDFASGRPEIVGTL